MADSCLLCCEPLTTVSVGSCNHRVCCPMCTVRMRQLMNDRRCCLCKQTLEYVIVTRDQEREFSDFPMWGRVGAGTTLDEASAAYFHDEEALARIQELRRYACSHRGCGVQAASRKQLERHLLQAHQKSFCRLCLENTHCFGTELQAFTQAELRRHEEEGEPSRGLRPHPVCPYCDQRHFDDTELYRHLTRAHQVCQLCEADGEAHPFCRDAIALERHLHRAHHPCRHPSCVVHRFVTFRIAAELAQHVREAHPFDAIACGPQGGWEDAGDASQPAPTDFPPLRRPANAAGPNAASRRRWQRAVGAGGRAPAQASTEEFPSLSATVARPASAGPARGRGGRSAGRGNNSRGRARGRGGARSLLFARGAVDAAVPARSDLPAQLRRALGDDIYDAFRELSARFHRGEIDAATYAADSQAVFPPDAFSTLFPRVVDELPDDGKRAELQSLIGGSGAATAATPAAAAAAAPAHPPQVSAARRQWAPGHLVQRPVSGGGGGQARPCERKQGKKGRGRRARELRQLAFVRE